mmetsp:Transcript_84360/g.251427  ORF Transcript_84360/g.251427 Transcript_84360/m.251427 type:complete len:242 (-) Transcript_84360:1192-1917(-)
MHRAHPGADEGHQDDDADGSSRCDRDPCDDLRCKAGVGDLRPVVRRAAEGVDGSLQARKGVPAPVRDGSGGQGEAVQHVGLEVARQVDQEAPVGEGDPRARDRERRDQGVGLAAAVCALRAEGRQRHAARGGRACHDSLIEGERDHGIQRHVRRAVPGLEDLQVRRSCIRELDRVEPRLVAVKENVVAVPDGAPSDDKVTVLSILIREGGEVHDKHVRLNRELGNGHVHVPALARSALEKN